MAKDKVTIIVYMEDGRRFEYEVVDCKKAREHMHRIVNFGWRGKETVKGNSANPDTEDLVYYPVHQINKVVAKGCGKEAYIEYPTK